MQPGAFEATKNLVEHFDIYIASNCAPHHVADKVKWLRRNLSHINPRNFISCACKYMINGDILVDDYEKNFEGFDGTSILFTQERNKSADADTYDFRALDWPDVERLLMTMYHRFD